MLGSVVGATLMVLFGGLMEGSFALPMKLIKTWRWEHTWMIYSVVGLVVIPWAVAAATVPDLLSVYHSVPGRVLLVTALFGAAWGIANVLFGLAVPMVGMSLSFAVVVGMSASLGSLVPLFFSNSGHLLSNSGIIVLAGVLLTSIGLVLLGMAGREREQSQPRGTTEARPANRFAVGMAFCVVAGLLAPMLNYSFAFGAAITSAAVERGTSPTSAVNAIWAIALAGGFISNGGYCLILLNKNRTWTNFRQDRALAEFSLAASMGLLWTGGILFYGWGATGMGNLGAAVGWPIFQGTMIVCSSLLGVMFGEWRGASARFLRLNKAGLAAIVAAIVVLSIGR